CARGGRRRRAVAAARRRRTARGSQYVAKASSSPLRWLHRERGEAAPGATARVVLYPEVAELVEQFSESLGCDVRLVLALAVLLVAVAGAAPPPAPPPLPIPGAGSRRARGAPKRPAVRPPGAAAPPCRPPRC